MLSPQDRVIMVSGAAGGIGQAVARCLHAKGYAVSLADLDLLALDTAVADLDGPRPMIHAYDARDLASAQAWVAATLARYGRLDGLVNCAGISVAGGIEEADEAAFEAQWAVNARGPLRMTRLALPHLEAAGNGRIVNLVSLSGKRVDGLAVGYNMSKFAMRGLSHTTRGAAWEAGVRVTAVCPGWVNTGMAARDSAPLAPEDMIQPADLAELIATAIALPNSASISELVVNCLYESAF
jgi:NAD(P)-dependent dehydrogenase (short-subunit alcohol dehydrogenase family)